MEWGLFNDDTCHSRHISRPTRFLDILVNKFILHLWSCKKMNFTASGLSIHDPIFVNVCASYQVEESSLFQIVDARESRNTFKQSSQRICFIDLSMEFLDCVLYSRGMPSLDTVLPQWWQTARCPRETLQWRHNEQDGVLNHQRLDNLLNRLFRSRSKKTSKLRVTGLCGGNSPVTGEFPTQRASNVENISIWWRHHECAVTVVADC